MANRTIKIEGYGEIVIVPINIKEKEFEKVDLNGEPLTWVPGKMAKTGYHANDQGIEVPKSHVRRKVEIDGEIILLSKFTPTKDVEEHEIDIVEDNQEIYNAIDRKPYNVFSDNAKLNKLILEDKKTMKFPLVAGAGEKMYNGVLTSWQGKLGLFGCRGNLNEGFSRFEDDTVELEISAIPDNVDKRKLVKAMLA